MRYLFFILLILQIQAQAQTTPKYKGRVSGKVTDSLTKAPVDFATISIFNTGETAPINGISADAKGNYTVTNLPAGSYRVTIEFLGYKKKTIEGVVLTGAAPSVLLATVVLAPNQTLLNTVKVVGQGPVIENKIDKLIYNAENDVTSQGGLAIDILKKVPMVSVDINGNVELMGSTGVRFLINGKPSAIFGSSVAAALRTIQASQIKSIEVITSPGAKYDAEGTAGIINIVLKSNKFQGINGTVNVSGGTRLEDGALDLNVRQGNFGVNAYFNANEQLNTVGQSSWQRSSYNNTRDTLTNLLENGSNGFKENGYRTGLGLSWSISKRDELTADISLSKQANSNDAYTGQDISRLGLGNNLLSDLMSQRNSSNNVHNQSIDMSIDYKKSFKKEGQELSFQATSSQLNATLDNFQRQDYLTGIHPSSGLTASNPGKTGEVNIQVDYAEPLTKDINLETGVKTVVVMLSSNTATDTLLNNGSYVPNPKQTYGFNYRRNVYAAYASLTAAIFNQFLQVLAGLRYERTNTNADFAGANIPGYNIFAPTFRLIHRIGKKQSINASYTLRITRPGYSDVNPFYDISDQHNINTGNPNLQPELSHNYELRYSLNYKKGGMYINGIYHYVSNYMQPYTTFYPAININGTNYTNVSLNQRINIGSLTQVGLNVAASVQATGKLNLRTNILAGYLIAAKPGNATVSSFGCRANINASYEFSDSFVAEAYARYRFKTNGLQGINPAFGSYDIAVRKQFMNKKFSIGLTATNPFSQYFNQASTTFGSNFNQSNLSQVPYRTFGISLMYKFGKLKLKNEKEYEPMQQAEPNQRD